ncbi:MAG TPA: hypothetical protein VMS64_27135 [Candidatus Methylomirabilis sp.]|nr:hypothetical protein [Candidatus Methylomirabilis sp.]
MRITRVETLVLNLPMTIDYCDFAENPLGDAIHPKNGRIAVPQGSGLGVDPDPRLLEKLRTG